MKKNLALKTLPVFVAVLFLGGVFVLVRRGTVKPLDVAAHQLLGCIEAADADCLMGYIHEHEATRLSLNPEKLDTFLNDYVLAAYKGYRQDPKVEGQWDGEGESYSLTRTYTSPDGRKATLGITVDPTEEGPKALLVSPLLVQAIVARDQAPIGRPVGGIDRLRLVKNGLKEDMPRLQAMGLGGFVAKGPDGVYTSWRDYVTHLESTLEKVEAKQGAHPASGGLTKH